MFPTLDVRNVVEASEKVTVPNWCDFGRTMCNQQFTVLPFRCLGLLPHLCCFSHNAFEQPITWVTVAGFHHCLVIGFLMRSVVLDQREIGFRFILDAFRVKLIAAFRK